MSDAPRRLPRQMAFTVVGAACTCAAMTKVDDVSLHRDERLILQTIESEREDFSRDQRSVTDWDDSVVAARDVDVQWLSDNMGVWMSSYFGYDGAFVLDGSDRPVYGMYGGKDVDPSVYSSFESAIAPLVAATRTKLASPSGRDGAGTVDIVAIGRSPAFVGVEPILPTTEAVTLPRGEERLHVALRLLPGALLDEIGRKTIIEGVHLSGGDPVREGEARIGIRNAAGGVLGAVDWDRSRPGLAFVKETIPAVIASFFGIGILMSFLFKQIAGSTSRIRSSEAAATHLSLHDPLTGLPNRANFNAKLDDAIAELSSNGTTFSLLYLDLDRFKNVNDTLGHQSGDELLIQVAARIRLVVGPDGTAARLSGDEFAVVVPCRDTTATASIARRLVGQMSAPFDLFGSTVFIGTSIGTKFVARPLTSSQEIMRRADLALYEAKNSGRGRTVAFEESMDAVLKDKIMMEKDLKSALDAGEGLRVDYQPVFAGDRRTVVGAEALIRWTCPVRGIVSPADFIPLAEERGLIGRIGTFVFEDACRTLKETGLPWVAVNASPAEMRTEGYAARVLSILEQSGIDPTRIQIEITEGILLETSSLVVETLSELRRAGIRIALDDFGTGYSSLQYLSRYPVDKIKIDQSFVRQLGLSRTSDAIVRAMFDLGRAMDLDVTAEGVETEDQMDTLVAMGCSQIQGFLLSRPVDAHRIAAIMTAGQPGIMSAAA
jgi:diguanylate cyclase (GGDEF)-like protein